MGWRGNHERLIVHTSLDYGYQFIGSLHAVDNKSQIRALPYYNILKYWSVVDFLKESLKLTPK